MSLKNTAHCFGSVAKFFHWISALLVIIMLTLGYFLDDIPSDWHGFAVNIHKSIGIIVLGLMALRLLWRWINTQPVYSSHYPKLYITMIHCAHYALYIAVILMALSGWFMSTASGHVPLFLGWIDFPMPGVPYNKAWASAAFQVHEVLAVALIVLIVTHICAGLFHHFILNDNVLKRMLFGKLRSKSCL